MCTFCTAATSQKCLGLLHVPPSLPHMYFYLCCYTCTLAMQVKCMKSAQDEQGPMRSQVLYNFGLCLWLLSFDASGMEELKKSAAVTPIVGLLKEGACDQ